MALVKFAPLHVPFPRRRQTAAVVVWIVLIPASLLAFILALFDPRCLPYVIAYVVFMILDPTAETGGRAVQWVRRLSFWKWQAGYFPISLVKTCDLDPSKNYVFGYHPHGIVSLGAWINFATEANHVSDFFPGLRIRLLTLSSNFHVPFWRELLLSLGLASVSRRSCDNILSQGPGNSCMIVVGGAAEALNAFPYTQDLVIKRRLGFIKLAIRRGASLVPCYSFGENDLWDQVPNPEGSLLRKFQHLMQKYTTISPPLFHGRGVWNYNIGIVPFRRPVTTVVGAPIHCVKTSHPSNEMVLEYQQRYMAALEDLWHTYKDKYAPYRKSEMAFVE